MDASKKASREQRTMTIVFTRIAYGVSEYIFLITDLPCLALHYVFVRRWTPW